MEPILYQNISKEQKRDNFREAVQLRNNVYIRCEHALTNWRLRSIFYVLSAVGVIWPSQNPVVKAQPNDHAGSSGNSQPTERDLEQKYFHWDNGKKKNLMLSYI